MRSKEGLLQGKGAYSTLQKTEKITIYSSSLLLALPCQAEKIISFLCLKSRVKSRPLASPAVGGLLEAAFSAVSLAIRILFLPSVAQ